MTITELIARARVEFLDDVTGASSASFWKDSHIIAALSQAEQELCRRLYLLHDSSTAAICSITIAATLGVYSQSYQIDNRILRIERLKYSGVTSPLRQTTTAWLDQNDEGWDEATGIPSYYVVDTDSYTLTFNRKPLASATVSLQVKRLPLISLANKLETATPELQNLDDTLLHGAMKYLFLKPDAETFGIDLSKKWDNQFETDIQHIIQNKAAMNPQIAVCRPERF